MHDKVTYEYAIIRLVPKVEREEFINVGVILFSKRKKYLDMKYTIDENKIRALSEELDSVMIHNYLKAWKSVCKGAPEGGKIGELEISLRFRWLVAGRSTIIQSSKTHPGLCVDPAQTLEDMYSRYVD